MFAIIKIGSKQYKVQPKDVIEVDHIEGKPGEMVRLPLLLAATDKKVTVGRPVVKGGFVTAKIVSHTKGEKIEVRRYKSKVRYRRHTGFRPMVTTLEINDVTP